MKKFLALLLSALMVLSVIPLTAFADEAKAQTDTEEALPPQSTVVSEQGETSGECGDNLTWSYDTTTATLTISGTGDMYSFYPVGAWFQYHEDIESVVISNSVTSIGGYAFFACTSLTSVNITDIDKWAEISFDGLGSNPLFHAHNLYLNGELVTEVVLSDSVTSIGCSAFGDCTSLTSITIGNSVTSIGCSAFWECTSLTSVTIPDSVTYIGSYAFYNCSSLKYNTYDNAYYLGNQNNPYLYLAEATSKSINAIIINKNTKFIGVRAFNNCTSLTSVTIPDSVTSIGDSAFYYCYSLTSVTIGNSVTSIGDNAFRSCTSLTSVTIPDSVTIIHEFAFRGCMNYDVYYAGSKEDWCKIGGYRNVNYPVVFNYVIHEHSLGSWTVTKKATCTTSGTQVQKCTVCKATVNTKTIKATGHKLGSWTVTKKATCTAKGTQVQKCTVCKKAINTKTIKATGHKLGSWTTTKKATCTQKGTQVQKCTTCKKVIKTKTVATVKHKLVYVAAKAATKTKKAVKAHYKCSVCKKEFADKSAKKVFKK